MQRAPRARAAPLAAASAVPCTVLGGCPPPVGWLGLQPPGDIGGGIPSFLFQYLGTARPRP